MFKKTITIDRCTGKVPKPVLSVIGKLVLIQTAHYGLEREKCVKLN